jgi:hypothetical protein
MAVENQAKRLRAAGLGASHDLLLLLAESGCAVSVGSRHVQK